MKFSDRLLPAPVLGGFKMADYWVWCGSVIRGEDGEYHMFAARWPKLLPFFEGYLVYSEIVRAQAVRPEGPYNFCEVVLPARGAEFWDGQMTHNPSIHQVGETYLLFYIGSTFPDPKPEATELWQKQTDCPAKCYPNIRIGLATSKSVFGPWERRNFPILAPRPDKWDNSVVTNPAPCILADGRILLFYRSNTPEGLRIGVAGAEHSEASFKRLRDAPILNFDREHFIEDPFVWWQDDHFELIGKDMNGTITGENHAGVHAISADGLEWSLAATPKAYSRCVRWDDGRVTAQGCLERARLLIENGVPTHLFAATGDGPGGFDYATKTWNMVIPLKY